MYSAKKYNKLVLALVLVLTIITAMLSSTRAVAFAQDNESVVYSDVLEDLHKDSTFDESNYPVKEKDYSLSVIQVAEGVNKELFVYVYQPATRQNFRANYISMSIEINNSINPDIYSLTYCNHSGTLYKYKVNDFIVSLGEVRFYEIYSIYRPFVEGIDALAMLDQTVNAVSFGVSKSWKLGEINGKPFIECAIIQTIDIDKKFVGFVRYSNSDEYDSLGIFGSSYGKPIDSHFVAFTTEFPIDELLEADVYYQEQQSIWHKDDFPNGYYGDIKPEKVTIKSSDNVTFDSDGWYSYGHFEWKRIQTVADFLSSADNSNIYKSGLFNVYTQTSISDEVKEELKSYQWVLRFTETEWLRQKNVFGYYFDRHQIVSKVSVLRLKFVSAGNFYNLGVIDNMQTGSKDPVNDTETKVTVSNGLKSFWNNFLEALKWIGVAIGVIIGLVLLYFVIRLVLKLTAPLRARSKERRIEKRLEKKQSEKKHKTKKRE